MLEIEHEVRGYGVRYRAVELGEFRFTLYSTRTHNPDALEDHTAEVWVERNYPGEGWGFHSGVVEWGQTPAIACQRAINALWYKVEAAKRLAALDDIRHNLLASASDP